MMLALTPLSGRALEFARDKHWKQRYGNKPYSFHLMDVMEIAQDLAEIYLPEKVEILTASAALHDVLEETDTNFVQLVNIFGLEVAEIVYAVTDELGRNRAERKAKTYPKIKANRFAVLVKLADRISNVRHAMNQNESILAMYRAEHQQFVEELQLPGEYESGWSRLDKLMRIALCNHEISAIEKKIHAGEEPVADMLLGLNDWKAEKKMLEDE